MRTSFADLDPRGGSWQYVGVGGAPWVAGWQPYSDPSFQSPRYRRDALGMVTLEGLATRASGTSDTMFVLPPGFRPPKRLVFNPLCDAGNMRLDVTAIGEVIHGSGTYAWNSLNGIQFLAEL